MQSFTYRGKPVAVLAENAKQVLIRKSDGGEIWVWKSQVTGYKAHNTR